MSRHTAAALEQCGHRTEAAALRTAMKLGRRAAAASASGNSAFGGQGTVAALASLARHRSDFWRAARKPWKVRCTGLHAAFVMQGSAHLPAAGHAPARPAHCDLLVPRSILACSLQLAGCQFHKAAGSHSWAASQRCLHSGGQSSRSTASAARSCWQLGHLQHSSSCSRRMEQAVHMGQLP